MGIESAHFEQVQLYAHRRSPFMRPSVLVALVVALLSATTVVRPDAQTLTQNAGDQARAIAREGARYNIDVDGVSFERTLNQPLAALRFLQSGNQRRSRFERGRTEMMVGRAVSVAAFREVAQPRLIGVPDGAAATGTFWIERAATD